MCSVIGYKGKWDEELLCRVFYNSRIRGLHSFGYAFPNESGVTIRKFLKFEEFVRDILASRPEVFIAHFRYSTSGDFNDPDNNQPLDCGNAAVCFNGVVSQKHKKGMEEEFKINLPTDNDGHVLYQYRNNDEFLRRSDISYAALILEGDTFYAIRNENRPLYISEEKDRTLICSTADIMKRSGVKTFKEVRPFKRKDV